ncbi:hypothetical protein [Actinomyces sp.]
MSKSKWTQVIKFSLSAILCALLTISITDETVAQPIDNCTDNTGIQLGICINTDNDSLTVLAQQQKQIKSSGQPSSGGGSSTLDDQRAQKTADAKADPVSGSYKDRCKELFIGKAANSPIVSDDTTIVRCELPPDPEGGPNQDPGRVPTTRDILYLAATVIHADGAGLYKRPLGVSYTNKFIPTIVAVTSPTQTHVINLLGRDITITLTATNYEWNWGDGTPNLVTTSTGSVWSEGMDLNTDPNLIRHYYTPPQGWRSMLDGPYPHEDRDITLTTTWSGTATNPFTGETQTINGLVTTTETTGKFPLSHLVINNTDTWEEKQGH